MLSGKLMQIFRNRTLNNLIYFDAIGSTNKFLAATDNPTGTIAAAGVQTGGVGKHGARWVSGRGGLWFSFLIREKIREPYIYVIISSIAVAETLEEFGAAPEIKWPNDVLAGGKKICGILIDNDFYRGRIITGIGVNLNNTVPRGRLMNAVSLKQLRGAGVDVDDFFIKLIKRLDRYISVRKKEKAKLIGKWIKRQADITGREIKVSRRGKTVKYRVISVTTRGTVLAEDSAGRTKELKGEIFFL
jgi:BirA family biotin operon repressor/biotin-[acetyl-CoA-carboxylase] ligase